MFLTTILWLNLMMDDYTICIVLCTNTNIGKFTPIDIQTSILLYSSQKEENEEGG